MNREKFNWLRARFTSGLELERLDIASLLGEASKVFYPGACEAVAHGEHDSPAVKEAAADMLAALESVELPPEGEASGSGRTPPNRERFEHLRWKLTMDKEDLSRSEILEIVQFASRSILAEAFTPSGPDPTLESQARAASEKIEALVDLAEYRNMESIEAAVGMILPIVREAMKAGPRMYLTPKGKAEIVKLLASAEEPTGIMYSPELDLTRKAASEKPAGELDRLKTENDRLADSLQISREDNEGASILYDLRAEGWRVAVHNDYRQDGNDFTFWLFTHPDGRWAKGESDDDREALQEVRNAIVRDLEKIAGIPAEAPRDEKLNMAPGGLLLGPDDLTRKAAPNGARIEFEMSDEEYLELVEWMKPVPMIALQCGSPPSRQAMANAAWDALGQKMGFEGSTVEAVKEKGDRFFTAETRVPAGVVIRFDGPPEHDAGRFVEVERDGASIKFGRWAEHGEYWFLAIQEELDAVWAEAFAPTGPVPDEASPSGPIKRRTGGSRPS